jgi:hypothetical protein
MPNTSQTLRNLSSILDELELNELIEEGLQLLGAEKHLSFNNARKQLMSSGNAINSSKEKLEGVNPTRDLMNRYFFFF